MSVFIVQEIYYDCDAIHGVFSSREKAQAYIDTNPKSRIHNREPSWNDIYEWGVDEES